MTTRTTPTEEAANRLSPDQLWDRIRRQRFVRRFVSQKSALMAATFLAFLVAVALLAPWLQPYDPSTTDTSNTFAGPLSPGHLLGTDNLGRDVLSRLIAATRIALLAAGQAVGIATGIGAPLGLVAGYRRGIVDLAVGRAADAIQSMPPLILAISIVAALGPGLRNAMLALGIIYAPAMLRVTRAAVFQVREETYIEASRSIGSPTLVIWWSRVLPNILPPLLVQISLITGFALVAEASLSLLGLGVEPPQASWGTMLGQGYGFRDKQSWLIVFPALAIAVTVLAFNVLGDGLRDSIGREIRRE